MKRILILLCIISALYAKAQTIMPVGYTLKADVVYKIVGDWQGKLDIYIPEGKHSLRPLLINVHGGGWVHGRKEDEKIDKLFFERGYVIANIEYRLAQQAPAPAAITDVRCALFYLVTHAADLGIDKTKIVVMGSSVGGHLALMGGLLLNDKIFDLECPKTKINIAAIIDKYGPTDLELWDSMKKPSKASSTWLGGKENDSLFVRSLSPVNYLTGKIPPVFIVHGDADHTVPYDQSVMLYNKLKAVNADVEFYTVKGGKHGNFSQTENDMIRQKIASFLDRLSIVSQP